MAAGLHAGKGFHRIVVEKPFGTDLQSARELTQTLQKAFPEDAVFRIDHYLGKETVQNILAFRFANSIFEPVWNANLIDSVQITIAEEIGIENRGRYYDTAGALRDIVQNHGLQLVTLTAMEPPLAFEAGAVRDEKVKVLRSIRPLIGEDIEQSTVRGQGAERRAAHPQRDDGLPVRHFIPGRSARGLRAAAPRLHDRRPDAVHPRRRGGGGVDADRSDRERVAERPAAPRDVPGRHLGTG